MGFTVQRKVYRLVFSEETDLAGLEVSMRSLTVDQLIDLAVMTEAVAAAGGHTAEGIARLAPVIDVIAAGLVNWNLQEEDGTQIPATRAALGGLEVALITRIAREWMAAVAGVPAPLEEGSTSGQPAPEASLPMGPP